MNRGLWIARKNYLFTLIKKVSDGHGENDSDFFQAHYHQVVESHPDEKIEDAISCYEDMVDRLQYYPERGKK